MGRVLCSMARAAFLAALISSLIACQGAPSGVLELIVVDAVSDMVTPARVELLGSSDVAHVPSEALRVAGDCGWLPIHNWLPWAAHFQMRRALTSEVHNPFTGTTQFYLAEPARMRLPAGRYRVRAFKGIEYEVAEAEVEVLDGERIGLALRLHRWVDLPAQGWHGADDHLHIPRPSRRFDEDIARWMEAEDVHVANLLQMGLARSIHITPQHAFGNPSVHQTGARCSRAGRRIPGRMFSGTRSFSGHRSG